MKKYIKLVLPIFLLFVFTINIKAEDLVCADGKSIKIIETKDAAPANFDAKVLKCEWGNPVGYVDLSGASIDAVIDKANDTYKKDVAARNAKDTATKTFTRCDYDKTNVIVNYTCTKTPTKEPIGSVEDEECQKNGKPDCSKCGGVLGSGGLCYKIVTHNDKSYSAKGLTVETAKKYEAGSEVPPKITEYRNNGYSCSVTSVTVKCPKYKCTPKEITIGACTPTYKTNDGANAYCVNPGDRFSGWGTDNAKFIEDKNFDVLSCESSYSTVNCGYANILIEGQYNGICYNAVNLALRLWGAHSGQSGYDKTGLSNAYTTDYKSCNNDIVYGYEGTGDSAYFINVYKKTVEYLSKHFEDKAHDIAKADKDGYINPVKKHFDTISCGSSPLGVICERGSGTYSCSGSNTTTSQTAFNLYFNTLLGNKLMKEHLLSKYGDSTDATPSSVEILPGSSEGKSVVELTFDRLTTSTEKGVVVDCKELLKHKDDPAYKKEVEEILPYCQVKVSIVDKNGKPVTDEVAIKECIKGDGCRTEEMVYAICDESKTYGEHIRVIYKKSVAVSSVKRYIPCDNPDNNQILFAIYDEKTIKDDNVEPDGTIITKEDYPISTYSCGGSCKDYGIRSNGEKCTKSSSYNGKYTSYYKDTSLSCIANMGTSPEKQKYDYTSYFGLNSNICRVYCSDEVSYTMPTKVEVNSGLSFKYNIEFSEAKREDKNILLSSVIKEKRSCVSEIYYSKDFPSSSLTAIKKKYDLSDSEMNKVKNWTSLFDVLATRSQKEGSRTENLTELVYDLYNCNLANNIPVNKPKNKDIGKYENVYDYVKALFGEGNNYGIGQTQIGDDILSRCKLDKNTNTCITLRSIEYQAGAEVEGSGTAESDIVRVGAGEKIDIGYVFGSNNIGDIKYCSGGSCLVYTDLASEKYNYDDKFTNKQTTSKIQITKNGKVKTYDIPTNDYALFSVVTEVGAYNSSRFETYPYTGRVKKITSENEIVDLEPYVYPVSKDAYSICSGSGSVHNCSVKQNIGTINTFFRKDSSDALTNAIKDKSFECFYDVKKPAVVEGESYDIGDYTIYRNVNIESLFPNARTEESNWTTKRGIEAKKNIEESAATIYNTDEYLEYSITINPEQSKAINRDYNGESYINDTIRDGSCSVKDGKYFDCNSEFIDELKKSSGGDLNTYGEMDLNYTGTSKHNNN